MAKLSHIITHYAPTIPFIPSSKIHTENTDLKTKLLDQVVVSEVKNINVIDVCIKANYHSPPKEDNIKEYDVIKEYHNRKIIEDVAKFTTAGHVRKITLSNEGKPKANIFFGKKIIRNERVERIEFIELNKHADISTSSSIRTPYLRHQDPPKTLLSNISIMNSYSK